MDFGFSEEQEQLREAVRDFFANETPVDYARAMTDDPHGVTPEVWQKMAELGWLGITIPVDQGGSGLGALELSIVLEEAGSVVLPGPLMSTLALAVPTLAPFAASPAVAQLLSDVATGTVRVTRALAEETGEWSPEAIASQAVRDSDGVRISGTKLFVPDAGAADILIVAARFENGYALVRVPAATPGVAVEAMETVDQTRKLYAVELVDVRVGGDALLGDGPVDASTLERLIDIERVALSAELCGTAAAALQMCVDYLQIREQFGRTLATFQSLQHRMADMKVALENARSLACYAAWALDNDAEDRSLACSMAKAYAGEACSRAVADAIQLHGGVGFTWEHDLHLFLKRAKANEALCGDPAESRERVARMLEL